MRATPLLVDHRRPAHAVLGAADLSARWADEAAVRQTVQYYFDGGKNRDSVALRKAFHPEARMLFAKDGKLVVVPIGEYIARVAGDSGKPGEVDSTKRRVTSVDVTGDAAIARLELERPDAVLTDYMSLLKVDGRWVIVNKIFTREPGGSMSAEAEGLTLQAWSRPAPLAPPPEVGHVERDRLERLRRLGYLLDNSIPIPGTRFRIGLETIIGLVPGIGDLVGGGFSAYIILQAARMGVPPSAPGRGWDGTCWWTSSSARCRCWATSSTPASRPTCGTSRSWSGTPRSPVASRRASRRFVALLAVVLGLVLVGAVALAVFLVQLALQPAGPVTAPPSPTLHSVAIFVSDLPRAIEFYRDALRLPVAQQGSFGAEFLDGPTHIGVHPAVHADAKKLVGRHTGITLFVTDLLHYCGDLHARGRPLRHRADPAALGHHGDDRRSGRQHPRPVGGSDARGIGRGGEPGRRDQLSGRARGDGARRGASPQRVLHDLRLLLDAVSRRTAGRRRLVGVGASAQAEAGGERSPGSAPRLRECSSATAPRPDTGRSGSSRAPAPPGRLRSARAGRRGCPARWRGPG